MNLAPSLKPHFITLEGGEGVGKTTLSRNLRQWFEGRGLSVLETREPGGTTIAQRIRSLFLEPPEGEPITKRSELYLVSAARAQHVDQKLRPALAKGQWIICDRFHDSSRVYQGTLGGVDRKFLETIIAHSVAGTEPHLTFLLDCDERLAAERLVTRASTGEDQSGNRFDKAVEQYKIIREGFLSLVDLFPERIVKLDASQGPAAVCQQAIKVIETRLFGLN